MVGAFEDSSLELEIERCEGKRPAVVPFRIDYGVSRSMHHQLRESLSEYALNSFLGRRLKLRKHGTEFLVQTESSRFVTALYLK